MKRFNNLLSNVFVYLNKKDDERTQTETLNLLMKLILSSDTIQSVEIKKQFDSEFSLVLAQRKLENENSLNAINSYNS